MGTIKHDSIVVTSWQLQSLLAASQAATGFGLAVTSIVEGHNGYGSFLIAPDGSKEGWPESDEADLCRAAWINWVRSHDPEHRLEWIHVSLLEGRVATIHDWGRRGEPEEGERSR